MVLIFGMAAMGLAAGYLIFFYSEWERKNAPQRKRDDYGDGGDDSSSCDGDGGGDGGD
jgi:hypothetical protein